MVTIIGKDAGAAKQITHRACGAILEYFPAEVRTLRSGRDISGGPDGAEGFTCPNCGQDVITRSW